MVPKELRLKIVGVVETEPAAGMAAYGNARLLMPLDTASTLRAAQVNDLRDIVRGSARPKSLILRFPCALSLLRRSKLSKHR